MTNSMILSSVIKVHVSDSKIFKKYFCFLMNISVQIIVSNRLHLNETNTANRLHYRNSFYS